MTEPTYAVTLRLKPAQREEILELAMLWDTSMTAACVRAVHEAYLRAEAQLAELTPSDSGNGATGS